MTDAVTSVRSAAGPLAWLAAVVTSLSVAAVIGLELLSLEISWPWGIVHPVLGLLMAITCVACIFVAAADCWVALARPAHHPAWRLRGAWILVIVACLAGGPFLALWLLPALVLAWAAAQRAKARSVAV